MPEPRRFGDRGQNRAGVGRPRDLDGRPMGGGERRGGRTFRPGLHDWSPGAARPGEESGPGQPSDHRAVRGRPAAPGNASARRFVPAAGRADGDQGSERGNASRPSAGNDTSTPATRSPGVRGGVPGGQGRRPGGTTGSFRSAPQGGVREARPNTGPTPAGSSLRNGFSSSRGREVVEESGARSTSKLTPFRNGAGPAHGPAGMRGGPRQMPFGARPQRQRTELTSTPGRGGPRPYADLDAPDPARRKEKEDDLFRDLTATAGIEPPQQRPAPTLHQRPGPTPAQRRQRERPAAGERDQEAPEA
ncbi:MAG: hypothetical protein ACYDCQ_07415 [Dehalococcoidia bacterium]